MDRLFDWMESCPAPTVRAIVVGVGACLLARLLIFTYVFAVNVPFSDQWSLLSLLFDGFQWRDIPAAFFFQHGPPRLGLSFALMVPVYHLSDWNIRLDAALTAFTQIAAGVFALRLRRALIPGPWHVSDAVLLLAFWALNLFETIIITPLSAHSIFPLLLIMMTANTWILEHSWRRTVLLIALMVCTVFTGFGLSILPAFGLLLLLSVWRAPERWKEVLPLFLGLAGTVLFFSIGYRFMVAAEGFVAWQPQPLNYLRFGLIMFNFFFMAFHPPIPRSYYPLGVLFAGLVLWISLLAVRTLVRRAAAGHSKDTRFMEVCLLLCGTTVTYVALTAYGRVQLGLAAATAPRYMALMLPAFLALHLWLYREPVGWKRVLAMVVLLLLFVRLAPETYVAVDRSRYYSNLKLCWFQSYKEDGDWERASASVLKADLEKNFTPVWMGSPDQWNYMKDNGLGPFAPGRRVTMLNAFYSNPCERLH